MNSSLQNGAESAMSIRIRIFAADAEHGRQTTAPLLELAERAERLGGSVWAGAPAKSPTARRHWPTSGRYWPSCACQWPPTRPLELPRLPPGDGSTVLAMIAVVAEVRRIEMPALGLHNGSMHAAGTNLGA